MKKRALAVMLAGVMVLGAQTGVWAASDTSDQKEGELTLLMTNSWIDHSFGRMEHCGFHRRQWKNITLQMKEKYIFLPEVRLPVASASPGKAFCIRQNLVTFWTILHRCLTTQQVLANLSNTRGVPTAG